MTRHRPEQRSTVCSQSRPRTRALCADPVPRSRPLVAPHAPHSHGPSSRPLVAARVPQTTEIPLAHFVDCFRDSMDSSDTAAAIIVRPPPPSHPPTPHSLLLSSSLSRAPCTPPQTPPPCRVGARHAGPRPRLRRRRHRAARPPHIHPAAVPPAFPSSGPCRLAAHALSCNTATARTAAAKRRTGTAAPEHRHVLGATAPGRPVARRAGPRQDVRQAEGKPCRPLLGIVPPCLLRHAFSAMPAPPSCSARASPAPDPPDPASSPMCPSCSQATRARAPQPAGAARLASTRRALLEGEQL